jgi:hypothetical protein
LTFTFANTSLTDTIQGSFVGAVDLSAVTGDNTGLAGFGSFLPSGTCPLTVEFKLGPGGSCTAVVTFTGGLSDSIPPGSETDADFGVTPAAVALNYCVFVPSGACVPKTAGGLLFEALDSFDLTVTDPGASTGVPEPGSAILFGLGLVSAGLFKRKRK